MKDTETIIDIPSRGGLRGRIDRLCEEYTLKAQALRMTAAILDEDDRKTALQEAPKKFLKAIEQRNGHTPEPRRKTPARLVYKSQGERVAEVAAFLTDHPGATTREIAAAIGLGPNTVLKYAPQVARIGKRGQRNMAYWVLRKGSVPLPTANPGTRQTRSDRQARLRAYLKEHPETYTRDLMKLVGAKGRSGFTALLRTFAKPAYPTKHTRPIQWVLL